MALKYEELKNMSESEICEIDEVECNLDEDLRRRFDPENPLHEASSPGRLSHRQMSELRKRYEEAGWEVVELFMTRPPPPEEDLCIFIKLKRKRGIR